MLTNLIFRHVKVNDSAEVCPDFLKGFCPLYDKCKKRHEHIKKSNPPKTAPKTPEKAAPPSKPKRKSISTSTPMPNVERKKRYFEENQIGTPNAADNIQMQALDDSFEKKRQRLLQKVELAKKGWTGLGKTYLLFFVLISRIYLLVNLENFGILAFLLLLANFCEFCYF